MNMGQENLLLGIDGCVKNGSLALYVDDLLVDQTICNTNSSGSSNLINLIEKLLKTSEYDIKSISRIIYTNGPGSYTGLRVVLSTVRGLAKSIGCETFPVSVLDAISSQSLSNEDFMTAILLRNKKIAYKKYYINSCNNEFLVSEIKYVDKLEFGKIIYEYKGNILVDEATLILFGEEHSEYSGRFEVASDNVATLATDYYIQNKTKNLESSEKPIYFD